jgi:hypothetical protein
LHAIPQLLFASPHVAAALTQLMQLLFFAPHTSMHAQVRPFACEH